MSVDVDLQTGEIYWSDNYEDVIMSSRSDGLHTRQVNAESLDSVDGLVIDSVGRKVTSDARKPAILFLKLDYSSIDLLDRLWPAHN